MAKKRNIGPWDPELRQIVNDALAHGDADKRYRDLLVNLRRLIDRVAKGEFSAAEDVDDADFMITFKANTSRRLDNIIANREGRAADLEQFWKLFIKHNFSEFMDVTEVDVQMKKRKSCH